MLCGLFASTPARCGRATQLDFHAHYLLMWTERSLLLLLSISGQIGHDARVVGEKLDAWPVLLLTGGIHDGAGVDLEASGL